MSDLKLVLYKSYLSDDNVIVTISAKTFVTGHEDVSTYHGTDKRSYNLNGQEVRSPETSDASPLRTLRQEIEVDETKGKLNLEVGQTYKNKLGQFVEITGHKFFNFFNSETGVVRYNRVDIEDGEQLMFVGSDLLTYDATGVPVEIYQRNKESVNEKHTLVSKITSSIPVQVGRTYVDDQNNKVQIISVNQATCNLFVGSDGNLYLPSGKEYPRRDLKDSYRELTWECLETRPERTPDLKIEVKGLYFTESGKKIYIFESEFFQSADKTEMYVLYRGRNVSDPKNDNSLVGLYTQDGVGLPGINTLKGSIRPEDLISFVLSPSK
jgi:hypothetical protein